jgi:hypothetical protein
MSISKGVLFGEDFSTIETSLKHIFKKFDEPLVIVEVGVRKAGTSLGILQLMKQAGVVGTLYCVDIDPKAKECWKTVCLPEATKTVDTKFILKESNKAAVPNQIHWCFIDACHCEDCVKKDILHYLDRIVPNGHLVFHDVSSENEFKNNAGMHGNNEHTIFGVRKAIDENNLTERGWQLFAHNDGIFRKTTNCVCGGIDVWERNDVTPVYIQTRLYNHGCTVAINRDVIDRNPFIRKNLHNAIDGVYISAQRSKRDWHNPVFETGYFWKGCYIDSVGYGKDSSFNVPGSRHFIEEFTPPEDIHKTFEKAEWPHSKYSNRRIDPNVDWDGVVLAAQKPNDYSIGQVGGQEKYWKFITDACKFYGKRLFIKLHPYGGFDKTGVDYHEKHKNIAKTYGASAGKSTHKCLENCEFVLTYNSTFAVDCFVRKIPVVQYSIGQFHGSYAVTFGNYSFKKPVNIESKTAFGYQLAHFLMWRYCFPLLIPYNEWVEIFKLFTNRDIMYPLPMEFSYGANIERAWKSKAFQQELSQSYTWPIGAKHKPGSENV